MGQIAARREIIREHAIVSRGREDESEMNRNEFELLDLKQSGRLLLGFLAFLDLAAKTARVLAVECALHCLTEAVALKVFRKHRCPRDRLEERPMAACRCEQRNREQDVAESFQRLAG